MRPVFLSVLMLLGVTSAKARLTPEFLADAYLLRAEKALSEGYLDRAQAEIGKIILLQKEIVVTAQGVRLHPTVWSTPADLAAYDAALQASTQQIEDSFGGVATEEPTKQE